MKIWGAEILRKMVARNGGVKCSMVLRILGMNWPLFLSSIWVVSGVAYLVQRATPIRGVALCTWASCNVQSVVQDGCTTEGMIAKSKYLIMVKTHPVVTS